jgi:hypothetical protein
MPNVPVSCLSLEQLLLMIVCFIEREEIAPKFVTYLVVKLATLASIMCKEV